MDDGWRRRWSMVSLLHVLWMAAGRLAANRKPPHSSSGRAQNFKYDIHSPVAIESLSLVQESFFL